MTCYTLALWHVSPGHEESFVSAWRELAEHTAADFPDATAVLLRDQQDSSLFISTGPWKTVDEVARWRSSPAFTASLQVMQGHLDSFEPHALDLVLEVGRD